MASLKRRGSGLFTASTRASSTGSGTFSASRGSSAAPVAGDAGVPPARPHAGNKASLDPSASAGSSRTSSSGRTPALTNTSGSAQTTAAVRGRTDLPRPLEELPSRESRGNLEGGRDDGDLVNSAAFLPTSSNRTEGRTVGGPHGDNASIPHPVQPIRCDDNDRVMEERLEEKAETPRGEGMVTPLSRQASGKSSASGPAPAPAPAPSAGHRAPPPRGLSYKLPSNHDSVADEFSARDAAIQSGREWSGAAVTGGRPRRGPEGGDSARKRRSSSRVREKKTLATRIGDVLGRLPLAKLKIVIGENQHAKTQPGLDFA